MGEPAQKRLIRKLDLERFLSQIKPHPSPKASLEQYTISEPVAATMLYWLPIRTMTSWARRLWTWAVALEDSLWPLRILERGVVVGIDIDKTAIKLADETAAEAGLKADIQLGRRRH